MDEFTPNAQSAGVGGHPGGRNGAIDAKVRRGTNPMDRTVV